MFIIKSKKVKNIYYNNFYCPECGAELQRNPYALATYPAQYSYYCDCGFSTVSSQLPGFEYEFEDEEDV